MKRTIDYLPTAPRGYTSGASRAGIATSKDPRAFWRSILSDPNYWARLSAQINGGPIVGAAMEI
jgi:hypothetical protein